MKITSKILVFALMCLNAAAAHSQQDCNSYLRQAAEMVSQKKYCEAKRHYQMYGNCNANADVGAEIAMCERLCGLQDVETEPVSTRPNSNTNYTPAPTPIPVPNQPDIITLKDGSEIQAKVSEIGGNEIRYTRHGTTSPSYTIRKSEIFMIKYADGNKDVFAENTPPVTVPKPAPVTNQPSVQNNKGEVYSNFWGVVKYRSDKTRVTSMEDLFYDTPEALKNFQSAKTWSTVGGAFSGGGFGLMGFIVGYGIGCDWEYDFNYKPMLYTGCGMVVVGTIFSSVASSKMTSAIEIYNASVRRQRQQISDVSLNFGITRSGGLGLTFNF